MKRRKYLERHPPPLPLTLHKQGEARAAGLRKAAISEETCVSEDKKYGRMGWVGRVKGEQ